MNDLALDSQHPLTVSFPNRTTTGGEMANTIEVLCTTCDAKGHLWSRWEGRDVMCGDCIGQGHVDVDKDPVTGGAPEGYVATPSTLPPAFARV